MNSLTDLLSRIPFLHASLLVISLLVVSSPGYTQTQRSGSDNTRIVQQLQQVTAENAKLQTDNDALKKELEAFKAKSSQTVAEQAKLAQRARELQLASDQLRTETSSNDEALQKTRAQLTELIGKFRETAQLLKDVEAERDTLRASTTLKERELTSCVDKNAQMYLLSDEVLSRLEDRGLWSTLKSKEPFTQLSRARLENLVDDYRDRIKQLKLADASAAAAVAR